MDILEIIDKKNQGFELNKGEIEFAVMGYVNDEIPDNQIRDLLEIIDAKGMSDKEIIDLTNVILSSGETFDLGFGTVDMHSTGGVGDKTDLVLGPLVAALGVKVAKMSDKKLGYTSGAIDKLKSINGFKTEMTLAEFKKQVDEIDIALASPIGNLCPADEMLYNLKDKSENVKSIPLMAASIMSKKLASGASKIIIDIKVGNGALMKTIEEARELARIIVKIGHLNAKEVICVLTDMNQPLGYAIGNALEVKESIDTLKGHGPSDLNELVINLGAIMLSLDKGTPIEQAIEYVENALNNEIGYEKFEELIEYQKGNISDIEVSDNYTTLKSPKTGYIKSINALKLGELVRELENSGDEVSLKVGFLLHKKAADKVSKDDDLITVYFDDKQVMSKEILDCFEFSKTEVEKPKLIYEIIK